MYFMILRRRRIRNVLIGQTSTYQISYAYSSCFKCENISHIEQDYIQCGKSKHWSSDDPVGNMLSYLCESRPSVEKIVVNAHNANAFDLHFILNTAILQKWQMELIMNGVKIM